ncbi:MAG: hypothetical protein GY944_20280 [bacterium]|nr:hypothetical protein [bacterium]
MLRRLCWGAGCCVVVLMIALPGYIATQRNPAGGPDDSDLRVRNETITPPEDGLHHLLSAVSQIQLSEPDVLLMRAFIEGGDVAREDIAHLLAMNADAFATLERALVAPHFRLPEMSADEFEFAPEIPLETEQLVDLLRLRSLDQARRGQWDAAFESALEILRLASRLEGASRAVLTTTMLSVGYRAEGLETLRRLAATAPLHDDQARRWTKQLPDFRSDPAAWKRMWAVEYQQWKALLGWIAERAAEESRGAGHSLEKGEITYEDLIALKRETTRTLEIFADMTRSYQRASEHNCSALAELTFPDSPPPGASVASAREIALEISTPDYRDFFLRRCAEDTALAATQTLIALRAYEQDSGRLPEQLIDLVPDYLEAIPTDSFRGEPIRYSRARRLVYSPGTSGMEPPGDDAAEAYEAFRVLRYPIEF